MLIYVKDFECLNQCPYNVNLSYLPRHRVAELHSNFHTFAILIKLNFWNLGYLVLSKINFLKSDPTVTKFQHC